ncbi:hypothetical protein EPUS_07306 [Endocarpon pusillum Z07020]|uniref:Uncharacterized protein n=1 Tax=Endocarpon pusillum (strain Z07020 / HMAS-L-300199) TaxID=1263415 RepID=U1GWF7_ENDPU|nr:uncharacterized protein EPUS_07306 [Endocarpon pusillum Z07020]ERF76426.1 hypothetical protein EPUS_07306 [Endocarpon pusillum Z07020]
MLHNQPFPLSSCSDRDLHHLCECLWRWEICVDCKAGTDTLRHNPSCPWPTRAAKLSRFFEYYKVVTRSYIPELLPGDCPALRSHDDLFHLISALKEKADIPRGELTKSHFDGPHVNKGNPPPQSDQNRAVDLAVRVMLMINCAVDDQSLGLLESGVAPLTWRNDETLCQFLKKIFPQEQYQILDAKTDGKRSPGIKTLLTASRLKSIARLTIEPTNDIRDHLRLTQRTGVVLIYHHVGFLIESLTSGHPSSPVGSLEQEIRRGNIPRQLALETLDSLQRVLFPADINSRQLLRTLVAKSSFDPACLSLDWTTYRSENEQEVEYRYLSARLMDLYEEILNPRPRSTLEKWAERRSGARHVMIAILVGVIIAIILGLLALMVSVFQAWIAYQAWKHPVANP